MEHLKLLWNDIRQGKNIGLIVTIVVALMLPLLKYFLPTLDQHIPALTLAVLALLANAMLANRYQMDKLHSVSQELKKLGIDKAYERLPDWELNKMYRNAKEEICILWTWASQIDPLPSGLLEAARLGVTVRILLLYPESDIACRRLVDLGFQRESTRPQVAFEGIKTVIHSKGLSNSIQIRFYDALPPFTLYRADDALLIGFFWHGYGSSTGPHIEVHRLSSHFGWYAMDTFEKIWDRASHVSVETEAEGTASVQ